MNAGVSIAHPCSTCCLASRTLYTRFSVIVITWLWQELASAPLVQASLPQLQPPVAGVVFCAGSCLPRNSTSGMRHGTRHAAMASSGVAPAIASRPTFAPTIKPMQTTATAKTATTLQLSQGAHSLMSLRIGISSSLFSASDTCQSSDCTVSFKVYFKSRGKYGRTRHW